MKKKMESSKLINLLTKIISHEPASANYHQTGSNSCEIIPVS
jgi:hypothetical protein